MNNNKNRISIFSVLLFLTLLSLTNLSFSQTTNSSDSSSVVQTPDSTASTTFSNDTSQVVTKSDTTVKQEPIVLVDTIVLSFLKYKTELDVAKSYFNVFIIKNYFNKEVKGKIKLFVPEEFTLISEFPSEITLPPGDSIIVPIRSTFSKQISGGRSLVFTAKFTSEEIDYYGNAYVMVPEIKSWTAEVSDNLIYFNPLIKKSEFKVYIVNNGNSDEMIKLEFNVGGMYELNNNPNKSQIQFIELKPKQDTTIRCSVTMADVKESEMDYYQNKWNEQTIGVLVSTQQKNIKRSVWFKSLDHYATLSKSNYQTPLTIGVEFYNLLSRVVPRMNTTISGALLLKKDRTITYFTQFRNFYLSPNAYNQDYFQNPQNIYFGVGYYTPKYEIYAGDLFSSAIVLASNGRGVQGSYRFSNLHSATALAVVNRFTPIYTYGIISNNQLPLVRLRSAVGISDRSRVYNNYSIFADVLATTSFYKIHQVRAGILLTNTDFNNTVIPNTTQLINDNKTELGFVAGYNSSFKRFQIDIDARHYNNKAAMFPNMANYTGLVNYKISDNKRIRLFYNRTMNVSSRYPEMVVVPNSKYHLETARLLYSFSRNNKVTVNLGPNTRGVRRQQYSNTFANNTIVGDTITYFFSRYIGSYSNINYKLSRLQTVSSYLNMGYTYATSHRDSILGDYRDHLYGHKPYFTMSSGLTYRDSYWNINASYNYGPYMYSDQVRAENAGMSSSQTFMLRPSYQRSFYDERLRVSAFANYILSMPVYRNVVSISPRIDIFLNRGWNIFMRLSYYTNKNYSEESILMTSTNINGYAGVFKSFDIPQPRIQFYDLNVVCFRDKNGNKAKDKDEELLSNILIKYEQIYEGVPHGNFKERELVTDERGGSGYFKLPNGSYKLTFIPLVNLADLFNVNGVEQTIELSKDDTLFVPYAESFRVIGDVIVERSEFSKNKKIDLSGVKVTAKDSEGREFHGITDNLGLFVIHVPEGGGYSVTIPNMFGQDYEIERDEYYIEFNGFKAFNVTFKFKEKSRQVNFSGADGGYQFGFMKGKNGEAQKDSIAAAANGNTDGTGVDGAPANFSLENMSEKDKEWLRQFINSNMNGGNAQNGNTSTSGKNAANSGNSAAGNKASQSSTDSKNNAANSNKDAAKSNDAANQKSNATDAKNKSNANNKTSDINSNAPSVPLGNSMIVDELSMINSLNEQELPDTYDKSLLKYKIEAGIETKALKVDLVNKILEIGGVVKSKTEDGRITIILLGEFENADDAKAQQYKLNELGLKDNMVVGDYDGLIINEDKAREISGQ